MANFTHDEFASMLALREKDDPVVARQLCLGRVCAVLYAKCHFGRRFGFIELAGVPKHVYFNHAEGFAKGDLVRFLCERRLSRRLNAVAGTVKKVDRNGGLVLTMPSPTERRRIDRIMGLPSLICDRDLEARLAPDAPVEPRSAACLVPGLCTEAFVKHCVAELNTGNVYRLRGVSVGHWRIVMGDPGLCANLLACRVSVMWQHWMGRRMAIPRDFVYRYVRSCMTCVGDYAEYAEYPEMHTEAGYASNKSALTQRPHVWRLLSQLISSAVDADPYTLEDALPDGHSCLPTVALLMTLGHYDREDQRRWMGVPGIHDERLLRWAVRAESMRICTGSGCPAALIACHTVRDDDVGLVARSSKLR